ncbi:unnamed protein product [Prorocentrum cordatum]|uniref:H(+)-exporting diphosphatase n=1 Tax=Prorocentrum cordatum TaxID=2364126 RepID=A0ABN9TN37_9DINO|nr:unnamed protein product [Polarella glacialis]
MWSAACGQILFSLSPGFGTAITMSSYTHPKENVFRTCMVVALSNSAFSLVGGFAIFSIVGNITYRINAAGGVLDEATGQFVSTTVAEQAKAGPGLAFIALADGMRSFGSGTNVMSVLFFMVLFTLGLDSTFAWAETFVSYVEDRIASSKVSSKPKRCTVVGCVCAVFYLVGLLYCTRMGNELLDTVDHYAASYFLLFGVAAEAVMFTFDFRWERLVAHVKVSTMGNPRTPNGQDVVGSLFWRTVIPTTLPALSILLFAYTLRDDLSAAYGGYPNWMLGIGWFILASLILVTILVGLWHLRTQGAGGLPPLLHAELAHRGDGAAGADASGAGAATELAWPALDADDESESDSSTASSSSS